MRFVVSSPLLRNVLIVDAAFSAASGVLLLAGGAALAGAFGLSPTLVLCVGVFCLVYAIFVGSLGLAPMLPRGIVWLVVAGNTIWAIESIALLSQVQPTSLGLAAIVGQATVVAALAAGQWIGLKRSAPAPTSV